MKVTLVNLTKANPLRNNSHHAEVSPMKRVRVVLCGDASVGKSSIIRRFTTGQFENDISETVAGAFHSAVVRSNQETIALELWDTAGSERYHSVIPTFFKAAAAVVIVYDVTIASTFESVNFWFDFARTNAPLSVPLFLVGNKIDLADQRKVSFARARGFAKTKDIQEFMETSAKTGQFITTLFALLTAVPPNDITHTPGNGTVISLERRECCST
jgi:small GTP-binding protein